MMGGRGGGVSVPPVTHVVIKSSTTHRHVPEGHTEAVFVSPLVPLVGGGGMGVRLVKERQQDGRLQQVSRH